jgi:methylated-DNA-[protein]-cysteine S-methyltransferase
MTSRRTEALVFKTPWGWAGVAASVNGTRAGVSRVVLPQPSRRAAERALGGTAPPSTLAPLLRDAQTQLREFLSGARRALDCPIDLSDGTPFQRKVWRASLAIPYGRARSYKWVAARVGGPNHARAVGLALGANPVPILVPCHRVVAQDGTLGGFSGGLGMKRRLLALEGTLRQLRRGGGTAR